MELDIEALKDREGSISLAIFDKALFYQVFPAAHPKHWPLYATLLSTTYLVGMKCPGEQSIFSKLTLAFKEAPERINHLSYRVLAADERFSLVMLAVENEWVNGSIQAFFRPKNIAQPSYMAVAGQLAGEEWRGKRVAIVGDSRGLGEMSAKICAAKGAQVLITYRKGADDARAIAAEIGASCQVVHWDAADDDDQALLEFGPTDVLYFVSPYIFVKKSYLFSQHLFDVFHQVYNVRFHQLIGRLARQEGGIRAFWPSSVAIEESTDGLCEYAMAKMAGEKLVDYLNKTKGITVIAERLPRLETDQTVSLIPIPGDDTLSYMAGVLERYFASSTEP